MKVFANRTIDEEEEHTIFIAAFDKDDARHVWEASTKEESKYWYPEDGWFEVPRTTSDCKYSQILTED